MAKCGVGARFIVRVVWKKHHWETDRENVSSHVLNAIVNEDGEVIYYDGQKGKKYMSWRNHCQYKYTKYARVDNLHMTDKVANCVYDKGKQPDRFSVTKNKWLTKEEADEGYETI